ncbi:MAG: MYXO-CTERM sorting domain-containing protein [Nannocystaceae bacterium]
MVLLSGLAASDASAAVVGPDTFGYVAADQDDGAVYNYVDITATGALLVTGPEVSAVVPLGAPFEIYGAAPMTVYANSNGFLTDDPATNFDATNDCPIPDPPSTGNGFRIYALHDDLNTSVYYQYFTEVEADMLGFPGETAGISVIQWVGNHDSGGGPVDVEAVLFHDDFSFLTMVAADAEEGSGSTLGIQNDGATTGLNYVCNTAMSVVPGVTAVQYTLGAAPDSDCCTASPTGAGGCINANCQAVVCDAAATCCTADWDVACADDAALSCLVTCGGAPQVSINEIRIAQPDADDDEFFELVGPPGTPLTDMQYIVFGDFPSGELEEVIELTGNVIPPSGIFVVADTNFAIGTADLTAGINFEDTDTVTHMLVGGLSEPEFANLDANGDGLLDVTPWTTQFDAVAVIHPPSTDLPYGPGSSCMDGPYCQTVDDGVAAASQLYRCSDGDGPWIIGNIDPAAAPVTDSPGAFNCCGNGMIDPPGEECDDSGESATCDVDCSFAMCGDGVVNMTAGEACDDGGESATCDDDCTAPMCGDGVVNMAAGEACDDMGESATCNDDCTAAACGDGIVNTTAGEVCDDGGRTQMCNDDCTETTCGDGVVNMTAGEECDDAGESETCDDDCSAAECGDGVVNMSAGEECDDGNTDDGDGCDAVCLDESGSGSTGGSTGGDSTGGETGADETAGDSTGGGSATSGPSTVTAGNGSSGGATDTDTDTDTGGAVPGDDGCSCRATGNGGSSGGAAWTIFGLLGLGAFGRRRRQ